MFLSRDDYNRWTDYINERVDDPEKGGFLCAENINSEPEVQFGGQYSELLPMMAALVYGIGYHNAVPMNQVLEDIKATWDNIKTRNGTIHDGKHITDLDTHVTTDMIRKLQTGDGVFDILETCCNDGSLDIRHDDEGGYIVLFRYDGKSFLYRTSSPGYLTYYTDDEVIEDKFENDKIFMEIIEDLTE